jgi:hypothetical protein
MDSVLSVSTAKASGRTFRYLNIFDLGGSSMYHGPLSEVLPSDGAPAQRTRGLDKHSICHGLLADQTWLRNGREKSIFGYRLAMHAQTRYSFIERIPIIFCFIFNGYACSYR